MWQTPRSPSNTNEAEDRVRVRCSLQYPVHIEALKRSVLHNRRKKRRPREHHRKKYSDNMLFSSQPPRVIHPISRLRLTAPYIKLPTLPIPKPGSEQTEETKIASPLGPVHSTSQPDPRNPHASPCGSQPESNQLAETYDRSRS